MYKHVRWCFNVAKWSPTREEWLRLTASISEEEITRINKFHYQDDSKSSIVGRALIRRFVSLALGIPSNQIDLRRTDLGRPVIDENWLSSFGQAANKSLDFNVSHSGDYCVLAGFWSHQPTCHKLTVGVDVTRIVSKKTKQELDRFLYLMSKREFLPDEWETVTSVESERQKCINFTRLWCLKECFIKSIGLGLSFKLDRICFRPGERSRYNLRPEQLKGRQPLLDTKVLIDNQPSNDWTFLETALDEEHLVAIGYNHNSIMNNFPIDELDLASPFVELDIRSLLDGITPISSTTDESNWAHFTTRGIKNR